MNLHQQVRSHITKNYKRYLSYSEYLCKCSFTYSIKPYFEDVLHEVLAEVLEFNDDKLEKIFKYLDQLIYKMLKINIKSSSGKFHQKYDKWNVINTKYINELSSLEFSNIESKRYMLLDEEDIDSTKRIYTTIDKKTNKIKTYVFNYSDINEILAACPLYNSEIFLKKIYKYKTFQAFSDDIGIPLSTIYRMFRIIKERIKTELKTKQNNGRIKEN
jgi:hypothetical protein